MELTQLGNAKHFFHLDWLRGWTRWLSVREQKLPSLSIRQRCFKGMKHWVCCILYLLLTCMHSCRFFPFFQCNACTLSNLIISMFDSPVWDFMHVFMSIAVYVMTTCWNNRKTSLTVIGDLLFKLQFRKICIQVKHVPWIIHVNSFVFDGIRDQHIHYKYFLLVQAIKT